jgi:hypothetical protein
MKSSIIGYFLATVFTVFGIGGSVVLGFNYFDINSTLQLDGLVYIMGLTLFGWMAGFAAVIFEKIEDEVEKLQESIREK